MEKYQRRGFVCWTTKTKVGGYVGSWPLGKLAISSDGIYLGILFNGKHYIKKSDIKSIELTANINSTLFNFKTFGKSKFCKITTTNPELPEWLAFILKAGDVEVLRNFGYSVIEN